MLADSIYEMQIAYLWIQKKVWKPILKTAKVYTTLMMKNDLSICDTMAYQTRKVRYEKVKVNATVRDRNLWTSQGTMHGNEIYDSQSKSLPVATETGVVAGYKPKACVMNCSPTADNVSY